LFYTNNGDALILTQSVPSLSGDHLLSH